MAAIKAENLETLNALMKFLQSGAFKEVLGGYNSGEKSVRDVRNYCNLHQTTENEEYREKALAIANKTMQKYDKGDIVIPILRKELYPALRELLKVYYTGKGEYKSELTSDQKKFIKSVDRLVNFLSKPNNEIPQGFDDWQSYCTSCKSPCGRCNVAKSYLGNVTEEFNKWSEKSTKEICNFAKFVINAISERDSA